VSRERVEDGDRGERGDLGLVDVGDGRFASRRWSRGLLEGLISVSLSNGLIETEMGWTGKAGFVKWRSYVHGV